MPLTSDEYVRGLLTPLRPEAVFFLIQAGYPADGVLLGFLTSINGLMNQESSVAGVKAPSPDFLRVLEMLRRLQLAGGLGLRVVTDAESGSASILTIRGKPPASPEMAEAGQEVRRLLGLDAEATEFKLVFAAVPANSNEVAVLTRSPIQLMQVLASQVDLPADHVSEGRATPGWESAAGLPEAIRLIHIHSAKVKPEDAVVAIEHRGYWFWIDDRDFRSKRSFSLVMVILTLASKGEGQSLPLITIPAQ